MEVEIPPGTFVGVTRDASEPVVRLAADAGRPGTGGMFVLAAVQGRTRVSFHKLSRVVAEGELARLAATGRPFSLVVSHSPIAPPSTTASTPQRLASSAMPGNLASPVRFSARPPVSVTMTPNANANTMTTTFYDGPDTIDELDSVFRSLAPPGTNETGTGTGTGTGTHEDHIRASVERLRAQRRAAESLKREVQEKTVKIQSLQTELRDAQALVQELRGQVLAATERDVLVRQLEDSVAAARADRDTLERELETSRVAQRDRENRLLSELEQTRRELDEERRRARETEQQQALRITQAEGRVAVLEQTCAQLTSEAEAAEASAQAYRRASESNASEHREALIRLERTLERTRAERDKAVETADRLEVGLAEARAALEAQASSRDAHAERERLVAQRMQELEDNASELRAQLSEAETRAVAREQERVRNAAQLEHAASEAQHREQEARASALKLRKELDEVDRELRAALEAVGAKELECQQARDGANRAQRHAATLEAQLAESAVKLNSTHERLLREMSRTASLLEELEREKTLSRELARSRLELLEEFVEEERRLDGALSPGGVRLGGSSSSAAAAAARATNSTTSVRRSLFAPSPELTSDAVRRSRFPSSSSVATPFGAVGLSRNGGAGGGGGSKA